MQLPDAVMQMLMRALQAAPLLQVSMRSSSSAIASNLDSLTLSGMGLACAISMGPNCATYYPRLDPHSQEQLQACILNGIKSVAGPAWLLTWRQAPPRTGAR